jgi:hypothetical protein
VALEGGDEARAGAKMSSGLGIQGISTPIGGPIVIFLPHWQRNVGPRNRTKYGPTGAMYPTARRFEKKIPRESGLRGKGVDVSKQRLRLGLRIPNVDILAAAAMD